jgi:hypothetical protein
MVDPVAAIRAKKAKILADAQREAEALDADARDLERLASLAEKYGYTLAEKTPVEGEVVVSEGEFELANGERLAGSLIETIPVDVNGPAYKAAISVAERTLREARMPLELSVLFDSCISVGVPLGGVRPQSTLSAYLSHKNSTVESIRKGVYWLKGIPVPVENHLLKAWKEPANSG